MLSPATSTVPRVPTTDLPGPVERQAAEQRILNARPIPPRRLQDLGRDTIPVTVRLVWERDGEQQLDTLARDWVGHDVLVDMADLRWPTRGVWVDADDVTRR